MIANDQPNTVRGRARQAALLSMLLACLPYSLRTRAAELPKRELPKVSVTLQGKFQLKQALAEVQKQTGNTVVDLRERQGQEAPDPELVLAIAERPFWPALDEIARHANVSILPHIDPQSNRPVAGIGGPDLATGKAPELPTAYSGPFRAVVRRVSAIRDLEMPARSKLTVTLDLACEPRFDPLLLRLARDSVKATDAGGQLTVVELASVGTVKLLGESSVELTLHLPLPPRSATELPELQLSFLALVHPDRLIFDFTRLASGEKQTQQGVALSLERIEVDARQSRSRLLVKIEYPPDSLNLESHQTWAADGHEVVLHHRADHRQKHLAGGPQISVEDGGAIRIGYVFRAAPANLSDWTLHYRLPSTPLPVPVQLRFEKLPLP
jgi:hypothetical protein